MTKSSMKSRTLQDALAHSGIAPQAVYTIVANDTEEYLVQVETVNAVTKASPGVVTCTGAHGLEDGDVIYLHSLGGMVELNDRFYIVSDKAATTFKLKNMDRDYINTTNYTTYTNSGVVLPSTPCNGIMFLNDTGNGDPIGVGYHGEVQITTDSPPPGWNPTLDFADLALVAVIGKIGDKLHYWPAKPHTNSNAGR